MESTSSHGGYSFLPVQLLLLCFLRMLDPLNFTQIFPYVNEFVEYLRITEDPSRIGFYSGLLESAFATCQLAVIYPWGCLADRIGRRVVILMSVGGLTFSTLSFGLSSTFSSALVARALAGLFSGNVAVIPTILCDITPSHQESIVFSFFGLWWPLGAIVGPLIGGSLSNPIAKRLPVFRNTFFHSYPYFLPSCLVAGITMTGFLMSFFFLQETLQKKSKENISHESPSYHSMDDNTTYCHQETYTIRHLLAVPAIKALCITAFSMSFISTAFDVLFVLFCYYPVQNGGLGLSTSEIGKALGTSGVIAAGLQLFVMPALLARFNHAKTYHICMQIWPVVFISIPFIRVFAYRNEDSGTDVLSHVAKWAGITVVLLGARIAFLAYSLSMLLVKEHSEPTTLGSTYALVQFCICLSRAISPIISSIVFSKSAELEGLRVYLWVLVMTAVCIVNCYISKRFVGNLSVNFRDTLT